VKLRAVIVLSLLMAGCSVMAIITANDGVAETAPSGFNWDYVYAHPDGSCVAIAPNWIITASHVADYGGSGTLIINNSSYLKKEIIYHETADIALIRYDKIFPGYYPLHSGKSLLNSNVILIGYGFVGTVGKSFGQYYFNDSGTGRGTRRWGSNKISSLESWDYDVPPDFSSTGFVMKFDASGTEAGVGVYDSGGGSFVQESGVWKLAGINTSRDVNFFGTGYDKTFAVSIPAYSLWINSIIIGTNDLDGDGIPNYWEQQYGTTTGLTVSADNDGDGFSNLQEYLADTDPTNAASFFEMSGFMASTVQMIYFTGSTARQYQVFYTTNDLAATNVVWIAAHTNRVWGAGSNSAITVTNADEKAFYRLRVTQP
jgi:hypothetical protein